MTVYLDHAAATPIDPDVLSAMQPYFAAKFHNPSALYLAAKDVAKDIADARTRTAGMLGAKNAEIIFTAGGTEANNLAINGVMRRFPKANIVTSAIEHESVLEPAFRYEHKTASVAADGRIEIDRLAGLIDERTVLVSVMYANNEIGTIQPLREIAQLVKKKLQERRSGLPLYFHTDAAQAANYLDIHVSRLGVDLMTVNGSKIYGPKQSGALYVRTGVHVEAQILGGGQERAMRSGTENVPGVVGLAAALELAQAQRRAEAERLKALQKLFLDLLKAKIPTAGINGSLKHRLPNNIHITIPGQDNERLIMALDEAGIQAAAGSACSASNEEPSHVLRAIGMNDQEAQASLRFTMGRMTGETAVHKAVDRLVALV